MGTPGLLTRVLAPSRGAPFTFAALDESSATAPGQPTAATLRDLYRIQNITERTMLAGLIGAPVAHSLSPQMHNRAFAAAGVDARYLPLEVQDLTAFLRRMVRRETREMDFNWRGFSVTAPHKQTVLAHLDTLDPAARDIGAVNTIVVAGGRHAPRLQHRRRRLPRAAR
jgi:3-dehydroquinate dehydratase/shikimate dehydrogenase